MKDEIEGILQKFPGIKAKEIARHLGFTRTEVNKVIYAHPNIFKKQDGDTWTLVGNIVFTTVIALISMSLAHYGGFLMDVPLQIVAAAGGSLAAGVTATFLFYVALNAAFSRVFIGMFQTGFLPLVLIITLECRKGNEVSNLPAELLTEAGF